MGSYADKGAQAKLMRDIQSRDFANLRASFGQQPPLSHDYYSTVSPENLVRTLRNGLPDLIREFVQSLDEDGNVALREAIDSVPVNEERAAVRTVTLSVTGDAVCSGKLDIYRLITDEGKALLEKFGPGVVEAVESLLRIIGEGVLSRADLSYPSTAADLKEVWAKVPRVGEDVGEDYVEPDINYSTLNPRDLIESMSRSLEHIPLGFTYLLPEDVRADVMARVVAAGEQTG